MMSNKRQLFFICVMAIMLVITALWNINWMIREKENAKRASEDLVECKKITRDIESLRKKPAVASTEVMAIQELGERIEAASQKAKFSGPLLEGVFPQSTRRIEDSSYLQKPTTLAFREIPLLQLATFLYHLTDGSQLVVKDLRLRCPHGKDTQDLWNAEVTLIYLIYSPPTKK